MDPAANRSGELFASGYYCAESVLLAVAESKGIASDLVPRIASGFCAGLARTSGVCGALSGAIMAISMIHGRNDCQESLDGVFARVQRLTSAFEKRFGSTNCKTLTGCDLATDAGRKKFKDEKVRDRCQNYTEAATELTMELI